MDKSFMVFLAIGFAFFYVVTTYIGEIQEEDENYQNSAYQEAAKYEKYNAIDSIGQSILDVSGADTATQIAAWNNSMLKEDFLMLFPSFDEMKHFINDRVKGKTLQDKLMSTVSGVEDKFFSGTMDEDQAKSTLGSLK